MSKTEVRPHLITGELQSGRDWRSRFALFGSESGLSLESVMNCDLESQLRRVEQKMRTWNAVAIVGSGISFRAGMPLAGGLLPLVWHAIDQSEGAKTALAQRLGMSQVAPCKDLIGEDAHRRDEAFRVISEDNTLWPLFQAAFSALDKERSLQASPTHAAVAHLLHTGHIELVVSLNWDTLLETAWRRIYGTPINGSRTRLLKPHGDAAAPEEKWVFPHQLGHIPSEIVELVNQLARERPRVLLVVGYSERDEEVVTRLVAPLSARWEVIRIGPSCTGENAIPQPAEFVMPRLELSLCAEPEYPGWEYVSFATQRDLGPAIAGHRLGPADVECCPMLPHVAHAWRRLESAHYAEIVGPPGCGKSVTAYQIAYKMLKQDWEVIRAVGASTPVETLLSSAGQVPERTLFLIDDAQQYASGVLRSLSELASSSRKVLIAAIQEESISSEAFCLSASDAVGVLAREFLARRDEVLPIVRSLDDHVGEGYLETSIEDRITQASKADTPWQFSFILRGGWRQARIELGAAREYDRSDLLLVAIAAWQLLHLDEAAPKDLCDRCAKELGRSSAWASHAHQFLTKRRLLLSDTELRCAHIRFASIVLTEFFRSIKELEFGSVCALITGLLLDTDTPLRGVSWLLNELRLADGLRFNRYKTIVPPAAHRRLVKRCREARTPVERRDAAYALTAMTSWTENGFRDLEATGCIDDMVEWLNEADGEAAYGLAPFLNNLHNEEHELLVELVSRVNPTRLARNLSMCSQEQGYAWGYLLGRLSLGASDEWKSEFTPQIDERKLSKLAESFASDQVVHLGKLASGLVSYSEDLAFRVLECGFGAIKEAFHAAPLRAWENLRDVMWFVLGMPPRFLRRRKPTPRQKAFARRIARSLPIEKITADLSRSRRRDWEPFAEFLGEWLVEADKWQYRKVIARVDLDELAHNANGLWARPPREMRLLFFLLACDKTGEPARSWIGEHGKHLEVVDPVVAFLAPSVAISAFKRGAQFDLFGHSGECWDLAGMALVQLATVDRDAASSMIRANSAKITKALQELQLIDCEDLPLFLDAIVEIDASLLTELLCNMDPSEARKHWTSLLQRKEARAKRAIARVTSLAKECSGEIASLARSLETKVPKRFRTSDGE